MTVIMQGTLSFMLISLNPSLRPPPCLPELCPAPTAPQLALLYIAIAQILVGLGGTRFIAATFGAAQLRTKSEQASFFSWYAMSLYVTSLLGITVVIYVQDHLGWTWGFGLSSVLSALGLIVLLLGTPYYRQPKPQKNPLLMLLCALMPTARKRNKVEESSDDALGYYGKLGDGLGNESKASVLCSRY